MFFVMTIFNIFRKSSLGKSVGISALYLSSQVEIMIMPCELSMLVYIQTASQVKSFASGGS